MKREINCAVITGPTGAIGTALCEALLRRCITVYAVCRPGSRRTDALFKSDLLHVVACDASELDKLPGLIGKQVDAFYHFAWAHTIGAGRNDIPVQIGNIHDQPSG